MSFYGQQIFNIPGWLLNDGTIDPSRLPDFTDGVVIGEYVNEKFQGIKTKDLIPGVCGKIYVDIVNKDFYIFQNNQFIKVNKDFVDENNDGNIEFK